jgi:predicted phage terminase large subunit-like protein
MSASVAPKVLTPARFAHMTSHGRWVLPPHLALLNRALVWVVSGTNRRLLVSMPPRHGKSEFCSKYFPAWFVGSQPERRVILASYEADFAAGWGRKVRDLLNEFGQQYFGVSVRDDSSAADRWDLSDHEGGMWTAGVGGPITGKGADLLIIDDPVKNAEEANSITYRDKAWNWYVSTAYTRLEPGAGIILIMTRWHADDLAGRIIGNAGRTGEQWRTLTLPALAEEDDPLGRPPGEALWPERYSAADLIRIRDTQDDPAAGQVMGWFDSLYQQRPTPRGGGFFEPGCFPTVDVAPAEVRRVRYWDKAGTTGGGAWTCGVLMSRDAQGIFTIEDVVRGQWAAGQRESVIRQTAESDGRSVPVWVEQEPGSGGKESAEATIRSLAGWPVYADRVTGAKEVRAEPLAAQAKVGNVRLLRADWNGTFRAEAATFPRGKFKDQIDAASGALSKLAVPLTPPPTMNRGRSPLTGYRG